MGAESDFAGGLRNLVSIGMLKANDEDIAEMVERLAAALGLVIAMGSKGDPSGIDTLCMGLEAYIHDEAVRNVPLARMVALSKVKR